MAIPFWVVKLRKHEILRFSQNDMHALFVQLDRED